MVCGSRLVAAAACSNANCHLRHLLPPCSTLSSPLPQSRPTDWTAATNSLEASFKQAEAKGLDREFIRSLINCSNEDQAVFDMQARMPTTHDDSLHLPPLCFSSSDHGIRKTHPPPYCARIRGHPCGS